MEKQVALRTDERSWMIYDPHTVEMVFEAASASALVGYGLYLQSPAVLQRLRNERVRRSVTEIGSVLVNIGEARQEINAGLAPNDVPDGLVEAQRGLDLFNRELQHPGSVPNEALEGVMDQIAAALVYLDQRTRDNGTNHPRWNSLLVAGASCDKCGR